MSKFTNKTKKTEFNLCSTPLKSYIKTEIVSAHCERNGTQNQKTQTKIISQQSKYHERKKTAHQSLSKPA